MGRKFKQRVQNQNKLSALESESTAFRIVERKYKRRDILLNMDEVFDAHSAQPANLEDLDPTLLHSWLTLNQPSNAPVGRMPDCVQVSSPTQQDSDLLHSPIFVFPSVPGLIYLPNAIPVHTQQTLIYESLTSYTNPRHVSNLSAHWQIPDSGLWQLHESEPPTIKVPLVPTINPHLTPSIQLCPEPAISLLHRIRWVTLGRRYNWITKQYDLNTDPIPTNLITLTTNIVNITTHLNSPNSQHDLGTLYSAKDWRPQAGVLNIYSPHDTLMGHVDHAEHNLDPPLVSLSIGASAIFLIGGPTRAVRPIAILIRSGDVVVMGKSARLAFHGIPRVFDDSELPYWIQCDNPGPCIHPTYFSCQRWRLVKTYMRTRRARINLNVRQFM